MKVRSALLALATTGLLLVAGCGSDSSDGDPTSTTEATTTSADGGTTGTGATTDGPPTVDELSAAVQEGFGMSASQADCAADKLADAGLPVESLQAIADADPGSLSEDERQTIAEALQAASAGCP